MPSLGVLEVIMVLRPFGRLLLICKGICGFLDMRLEIVAVFLLYSANDSQSHEPLAPGGQGHPFSLSLFLYSTLIFIFLPLTNDPMLVISRNNNLENNVISGSSSKDMECRWKYKIDFLYV